MVPHLEPGQRLYVSWLAHLLHAQLHLIDGHAERLLLTPLAPADMAHVEAIRAVVRQLVSLLDDLTAGRPPRGRGLARDPTAEA